MRRSNFLFLIVTFFALVSAARAKIIYVRTSGSNGASGTSWATAKATVSGATGALSIAVSGDEIWVAAGNYTDTFFVPVGVKVYGGFPSAGGDWSTRDPSAHEVVLNTNRNGAGISFESGGDLSQVFDGFTVTNANGPGINAEFSAPLIANNHVTGNDGTGIRLVFSSGGVVRGNRVDNNHPPTGGGGLATYLCDNVLIEDNWVTDNTTGDYGAGYQCWRSHTPVLRNNHFLNNRSGADGGGMLISESDVVLEGNTIEDNVAGSGSGGGVMTWGPSNATLSGNTLRRNTCPGMGGGIHAAGGVNALYNNLIENNTAGDVGGGVVLTGGSPCTLEGNTVRGNVSQNAWGGGIYIRYCPTTFSHNTVEGNTCPSDGAGIVLHDTPTNQVFGNRILGNQSGPSGNGAGLSIWGPGSFVIANNLFADNRGQFAVALSIVWTSLVDWSVKNRVVNNTIVGSVSSYYDAVNNTSGGSIGLWQASVHFANNIIALNPAGGIYSFGAGGTAPTPPSSTVRNCLIEQNIYDLIGLVTVVGRVTGDPQFVNPTGGDYRLQATSPAIDRGDNSLAYGAFDLDGATRVQGSAVDLGTYEFDRTPPAPVPASVATDEDTPVPVTLSASDGQSGIDPAGYAISTPPAHGTLTGVAPNLTYTPAPNFNGGDAFAFTVTDRAGNVSAPATISITVRPVQDDPVAADDLFATDEDTPLSVGAPGVLGNDSDSDGEPIVAQLVSGPAHGTLTLNPDGGFLYTPDPNWHGTDTFAYTAGDGQASSAVATVTLTVRSVNDPPVASGDSATTAKNTPALVAVLGNDSDVDGDALTIASVTQGAHGSVVLNANGTLTYTPVSGYIGPDQFQYTVSDGAGGTAVGTVDVTVTNTATGGAPPTAVDDSVSTANHTPVTIAVLGNDSGVGTLVVLSATSPANGTVAVDSQGVVTYTPTGSFSGTDQFQYTITDANLGVATATVKVTVAANKNPVAVADSASVLSGNAVAVSALANDTDPEGDSRTITGFTQPASGGTVTLNPDQTFTVATTAGFKGKLTFTYTISDGYGGSATGTVAVTVTASSAPVATNDSVSVAKNAVDAPIEVLANDSDPSGGVLSIDSWTPPTNGTVRLSADGRKLLFTPAPNYKGKVRFDYTISSAGGTATATVTVTVS